MSNPQKQAEQKEEITYSCELLLKRKLYVKFHVKIKKD